MSMSSSPSAAERRASWNHAMSVSPGELDVQVSAAEIRGQVPEVLRGGTVYSNGPGWTRIGERTAHPFDGHGYVRAVHLLPDGSVQLRARFVETPSYLAEKEAGRLVHRGLATNVSDVPWQNWGSGPPRNVANTTLVKWGRKLLAGWEAGCPHALDPLTLETLGEERFGGALDGSATLAHMRYDTAAERLTLCGVQMGMPTKLTFRELSSDEQVVRTTKAVVPGLVFLHDYALTPSTFIVGGNPLRLKPGALLKSKLGLGVFFHAVTPNTSLPGVLHLVARDGSGTVRSVSLPSPAFVVHFGNAFERPDGTVVVDMCAFESFDFGAEFGYQGPHAEFDPSLPEARRPQRLYRVTIPPGATAATWELLTEHGVDFPRFHPEHEGIDTPVLFGATRRDTRFSDPFDSVIRVELGDTRAEQLWTAPDGAFVGEPLFAPSATDPREGHVLVLTTDGRSEKTTLEIFDAGALEAGPVASIPLPLLPVAFHGEWVSAHTEPRGTSEAV